MNLLPTARLGGTSIRNRLVRPGRALAHPSKLGVSAKKVYFTRPQPSIDIASKDAQMGKYFHEKAGFPEQLILCPLYVWGRVLRLTSGIS